jgi:hypothetical protein
MQNAGMAVVMPQNCIMGGTPFAYSAFLFNMQINPSIGLAVLSS